MSNLVLYGIDFSPPVRATLLTMNALELPFDYKIVNMLSGEHLSPEYLEHNPQHTVPLLNDNGTWIWDSHAISSYLVDKYAKDDSLYPKDLAKRAVVNQRMFFDASILFMALRFIAAPFFSRNEKEVSVEKFQNVLEGYEHLENFLGAKPYVVGENITIADFCCVATIFSLNNMISIDEKKFPKILAWIDRLSTLPYYEKVNSEPVKMGLKKLFSALKMPSV